MTYHNLGPNYNEDIGGKDFPKFMEIDRQCSLTFCCLNRPVATITESGTNRLIGKMRDPWHLFNFTYEVLDASDNVQLATHECCCQIGTICPCPGQTVPFSIKDPGTDTEVAKAIKTWMMGDLCPLCFKDWDNNVVHFQSIKSPDYKLLMIAMTTFIQMRLWDARQK